MTALYSGVDLNAMVAAVGAYFIFMYIDNSKINDVYFCSGTVNIDSVLLVYILTAEVRYFWDRNVMQSAAVAKVWMYLLMTGKLALLIANIVFWKKGRRFRMSFRELMMWTALLLMFMTPAFNSTRKGTQCYVSTLQHCEECSVRWGAGALGAMPVAHTAADVAPETNMVLCTETVTFTASFEDAKDSKHVVNAIKTNATNATQQAIVTSLPAVSTQGAQRKPWVLPPVGSGTNTSSMSAKLRGRAREVCCGAVFCSSVRSVARCNVLRCFSLVRQSEHHPVSRAARLARAVRKGVHVEWQMHVLCGQVAAGGARTGRRVVSVLHEKKQRNETHRHPTPSRGRSPCRLCELLRGLPRLQHHKRTALTHTAHARVTGVAVHCPPQRLCVDERHCRLRARRKQERGVAAVLLL
eukprot:3671331-Rhodomonas_salina.1